MLKCLAKQNDKFAEPANTGPVREILYLMPGEFPKSIFAMISVCVRISSVDLLIHHANAIPNVSDIQNGRKFYK